MAKYSPSGFYIASADKSGKVRIWDTVNKEHILKNEFQPISGPIKDLAWSNDNQRSVTCLFLIVKPWSKSGPLSQQAPKLNKSPPKKEKRRIWTKG